MRNFRSKLSAILCLVLSLFLQSVGDTCGAEQAEAIAESDSTLQVRDFSPTLDGKWIGQGISFGPYREGQAPGGEQPTRDQLTADLKLVAKHWQLIRMYGCQEISADVLAIIKAEKLPIRVMLGAWITREVMPEEDGVEKGGGQLIPAARKANKQEVAEAIRLANAYPEIVIAVSVGNETQVFWSSHRTSPKLLIKCIRQVRSATKVPVTTADDFNFWNKPESQAVANEIDFIVTHLHPHWAGTVLAEAVPWTKRVYAEVCQTHPSKQVVIGETGWATSVHTEGEQSELIKGKAGEQEQRVFYEQFTKWASKEKICTFYFEAFDEPWKGGPHPNEVEKHWGLFNENRQPKAAMAD